MADTYVTNSGFSPVDTRQLLRQDAAYQGKQDVIGDAGINRAADFTSKLMSFAGPTISAAAPFMGMKGAAITGAAISAIPNANGAMTTPGLVSYSKNLGMPGTAPGFPGSGGTSGMPGAAPGFPGAPGAAPGGSSASSFDSQINSMQTQQIEFLALQTKVQNVSQVSQMMSNIAKTDSDAKLNAIRNVRS